MPYVDGVRVSLAEYKILKAKVVPSPAVSDAEEAAILGKPTPKQRKAIVKRAAEEATGVALPDELPQIGVESE